MDAYLAKLIDTFQQSTKERKLELIQEIARVHDPESIQFLVNAMGDEFWLVRKMAADALFTFEEEVLPALSGALNSYSEDIQHWALQVLARFGKKGTPAILRALKNTNQDVRFFACAALGEMREKLGIPGLLRCLGDDAWQVRKAASEALAMFGDEIIPQIEALMLQNKDEDVRFWAIKTLGKLGAKAQRILLDALRSGDKHIRYVIAAALGKSGDKRVIRVLIESLADPDWTIRKSATVALSEIGANAIEPMVDALKEPNEDIRDGCLIALIRSRDKALEKLFEYIIEVDENQRFLIRRSLVKLGNRVIEPMLRLFTSPKAEVLCFAAATLGELGAPKAVPQLLEGLSHESWNVRRSCAYALSEIGEKGVERIAEALSSPNDDVRYWVTRILESIGEPGMPFLVKALKDQNKNIRYFAARALETSRNPDVVRHLIAALGDVSWSVRKAASESIAKMEGLSIDQLLRNMSSDNQDIQHWIGKILETTGTQFLEDIHEAVHRGDPELRLCACQALGAICRRESIDHLITALRDDNEWVRIYAAIALGKIGDTRAIIPLIRGLSDRNAEIHRHIGKAFEKIGPKVFDSLAKATEHEDPILRRNSAIAIAELAEERGVDLLVLLMGDQDKRVRQAAAEALSRFPSLKAHTILTEGLEDQEYSVRMAAANTIAEHGRMEGIKVLMDYLTRIKDDREIRTVKRFLSKMATKNVARFTKLFLAEQAAVRTMAAEALIRAGLAVMPAISELAVQQDTDATVAFWCKKVMQGIRNPQAQKELLEAPEDE